MVNAGDIGDLFRAARPVRADRVDDLLARLPERVLVSVPEQLPGADLGCEAEGKLLLDDVTAGDVKRGVCFAACPFDDDDRVGGCSGAERALDGLDEVRSLGLPGVEEGDDRDAVLDGDRLAAGSRLRSRPGTCLPRSRE